MGTRRNDGDSLRPIKKALLLAAIAVLGGRLIWMYILPAWDYIVTDFPNYYVSAWAVRHGEPLADLYDPVWFEREKHRAGIEKPAALFNYFPPMNALIMWPLAHLPPIQAKRAWTAVNLIALAVLIALTAKASGLGWLPSTAVALLATDALGNNFAYGQFYIVLTLLMAGAVLISGRFPAVAGFAAAAGTVTKLFPIFLLAYFAIRGKRQALMWAAISIALLVMLGLAILGWAPHQVYLDEVLGRTLRGEIQDPYNVHWNTLQAMLRRAFVYEPALNPEPILAAPWLFFFLRPLISVAIAAITFFAIGRARLRNPLLEYGAIIAMVSLITPSQASYHQFLFYPAIVGSIAQSKRSTAAFTLAGMFALICSNAMGATASFDKGLAMVFAFPRVYLVLALWGLFLFSLNPPRPTLGCRFAFSAAAVLLVIVVLAFVENQRWVSDMNDGATLVARESRGVLEVHPRFDGNGLITSSLGADGFNSLPAADEQPAVSPDGRWSAFATNVRGNWDIALRSNTTSEIRFLTRSSANDLTPTFSPDGKSVYFASDRHRGYRFTAIYRVDLDAR